MKPAMLMPAGALDRKPKHGQPCNSCGLCCQAMLCPLAQHLFQRDPAPGPCPALLRKGDGTSGCGVAADPSHYAPFKTALHGLETMRAFALLLIGANTGCDARFNGEPADQAFYAELLRNDRRQRGRVARAGKAWGVP